MSFYLFILFYFLNFSVLVFCFWSAISVICYDNKCFIYATVLICFFFCLSYFVLFVFLRNVPIYLIELVFVVCASTVFSLRFWMIWLLFFPEIVFHRIFVFIIIFFFHFVVYCLCIFILCFFSFLWNFYSNLFVFKIKFELLLRNARLFRSYFCLGRFYVTNTQYFLFPCIRAEFSQKCLNNYNFTCIYRISNVIFFIHWK